MSEHLNIHIVDNSILQMTLTSKLTRLMLEEAKMIRESIREENGPPSEKGGRMSFENTTKVTSKYTTGISTSTTIVEQY